MRRMLMTILAAVLACGGAVFTEKPALAADLCVGGPQSGCFSTIQAAVDAGHDGDTIHIGPGRFAGGITILKEIQLVGAGAGATTIEGGGPVITIGKALAPDPPIVSISDVTITGGLNVSAPVPFAAFGGGVWIPLGAGGATGATVSISRSVISGNRADPGETFAACGTPGNPCAFAFGGGIFNQGPLTVTDSLITGNVAGSTATDPSLAGYAAGGGIDNGPQGSVTLLRSFVNDNRAAVNAPNGFNTDAGGISSAGRRTVEDSVISDNTSSVAASKQAVLFVDILEANAGGIYLPGGSSTTIRRSRISGNTVIGANTAGDVQAEAGGIDSDGSLLMIDSSVDHNRVTAFVPAESGFTADADSGGLQVQDVTTLRNSRVTHNMVSATSMTGTALAAGAGLLNLASLTLEHTVVTANGVAATGATGASVGAGIGNIHLDGPRPQLTVTDSVVAANRLSGSPGISILGGGLFNLEITNLDPFTTGTPLPVTLTRTVIQGNMPDQCAGC